MTRQELYEQVWSQPMRTFARSLGISDVALAKRCRAANIPVPPRGWWARKEAGKAVKVTPLPATPFVMANYFPAFDEAAGSSRGWRQVGLDEAWPDPPVFRDIGAVREEIRAAVKPFKVPTALTAPHPAVARLLRMDAERKPDTSSSRYFPDRNSRKFDNPIQQRRLRILSSIFGEFERLGCKISGATHAGEKFSINIGGAWTYILFGIEGGERPTWHFQERKRVKAVSREQLRFDLVEHGDRSPALQTWHEDETPLEKQVVEIVRGLLIKVEDDLRRRVRESDSWGRQDHQRRIVEAKRTAEAAEVARVAREKAAAAARIEALLEDADALERAGRIRRYVAAVQAASADEGSIAPTDLSRWSAWALEQADLIDPIVSGVFLSRRER